MLSNKGLYKSLEPMEKQSQSESFNKKIKEIQTRNHEMNFSKALGKQRIAVSWSEWFWADIRDK